MPNWCGNKLTVHGPKAEVQRFIEEAIGPEHVLWKPGEREREDNTPIPTTHLSLPQLVPPPAELLASLSYDRRNHTKAAYEQGLEVLGIKPATSGCSWQVQHWGTKWGVEADAPAVVVANDEASAVYEFQSAWSPITPAVRTMSARYPALRFELQFIGEGNDFSGRVVFQASEPLVWGDDAASVQRAMQFLDEEDELRGVKPWGKRPTS
jgi:hypothetical protein